MYRFGKHPPKIDYRTLRFKNYVMSGLAPPPPSFDVKQRVYTALNVSDAAEVFPMDGNDQYGDCTIAARYHADTLFNGMVGKKKIKSTKAAVKLYFQMSGGVDSGLVMLDVLNNWQSHRGAGDKLLAFVSIDPKNREHVCQAIALFGCVYIGFQVQNACLDEFTAHEPWTPGPLTNDGHCVTVTGYTGSSASDFVNVLTWGTDWEQGTWAWWDECVDECYGILPPEASDPNYAPGFNLTALQADLQDVAG
jgi:hypothetical protein